MTVLPEYGSPRKEEEEGDKRQSVRMTRKVAADRAPGQEDWSPTAEGTRPAAISDPKRRWRDRKSREQLRRAVYG
ncbi:hypothetical protein HPP92_004047 [Vanilla planifolia]|uniref:Uncharacterized protein n=1 Tax=Vanilla planifolia TaxID=51239 RepID=A0A835S450_VANPL|nr:hypothetical protein HPP92_004047 [Vanilla planifolia]